MRQRNPNPWPVDLMETRDPDTGEVFAAVEVPPGGEVDWPVPIAGFEPADNPTPEPPAPDSAEGPGTGAGPSKPPRKPGRASAATDEEPAP